MAAPECKQEPGIFAPVVDRAKCEGKRDCEAVCPYNVFTVRVIDEADYAKALLDWQAEVPRPRKPTAAASLDHSELHVTW